jgi:hypothetical protein
MDFLSSWPAMIGMGVLLIALIGLMLYMRSRPQDDE